MEIAFHTIAELLRTIREPFDGFGSSLGVLRGRHGAVRREFGTSRRIFREIGLFYACPVVRRDRSIE